MFFYILYCIFGLISTIVEKLSSSIPLPLRNAFSTVLRLESTTVAQRPEDHASSLYSDCGHHDSHHPWSGLSATDWRASNEVAIVRQNVYDSVTLFYKTIAGPQKYCPLPTTIWKSYKFESSNITISMEKDLESKIAVGSDVDTVASTATHSEVDYISDESESDDDSLTDVSEDDASPKDYDHLFKQGGNRLHLSEHVSCPENTPLQACNTAEIIGDAEVDCITEGISTTSGHSHQLVGLNINHNPSDFDGLATVDQCVIEAQLARVLEALNNASVDSYDLTGREVCNSSSVLDSSIPVETYDLLVFGTNEDMPVQDISASGSSVVGDLIEFEMATIHGEPDDSATYSAESYPQLDVEESESITHMSSHDLLGLEVEDMTPEQDNAFASASTGLKDLVGLEMAATPGKPDTYFDQLNDLISPVRFEEGNVDAMEQTICFSLEIPHVRSFTAVEASAQEELDDCACPLEICETYFAPSDTTEQSNPKAIKAENDSVPRTKSFVSLPEILGNAKEELSRVKYSRSLGVSDMVEAAMNDNIYEAPKESESPENNAAECTTGTTTDILTTMGEKPGFPYGTGWRVVVPTRFVVTENSTRILSFVDRTYEQFCRAQEPVVTTKPGVYTQEVPLNERCAEEDWEMVLV